MINVFMAPLGTLYKLRKGLDVRASIYDSGAQDFFASMTRLHAGSFVLYLGFEFDSEGFYTAVLLAQDGVRYSHTNAKKGEEASVRVAYADVLEELA